MNVADLEDYLELHDSTIQKRIRDGYDAYRRGKARSADSFLAELRRETVTRSNR